MLKKIFLRKECDSEYELLMQRAEILDSENNLQGLKDLQKTVWRQLQSQLLLMPYIKPDHAVRDRVDHREFMFLITEDYQDMYVEGHKEALDLSSDVVITNPWHPQRIIDNLGQIGKNLPCGSFRQSLNHTVHFYWPLNVGIVSGGNHSIAQGIIRSEGILDVEDFYDLSALISRVNYDGKSWVLTESNQVCGKPSYKEIGWAWEIGRLIMKYEDISSYCGTSSLEHVS